MGDPNLHVDVEKLLPLVDDLNGILEIKKDIEGFMRYIEGQKTIKNETQSGFKEVQSSLEEYEKRISLCEEKIEKVRSETIPEDEIKGLQNEMKLKLQNESALCEELRMVQEELESLEHKRVATEKLEESAKKREKDLLLARNLLSMYASVTNIVPSLSPSDEQMISGYVVSIKKKKAKKFCTMRSSSPFDTCNEWWELAKGD